ncbi:hypothetical protein CVS30_07860 [Arthrobacter psychrolactophilus]|uniref:HTH luxR-type domain-containing protein n=1 Tax=Arthrobacter psychrolactophilus TaxID=92442 RepID=A0A2V5IRW3_9MICC|nr:helix-turn-helix transcriptional regulator [Arthrobacter psychrolactophilus]PYI38751.1 hypothetical protein CVS30_07860 [Arthrobacter psychrolactophilus]
MNYRKILEDVKNVDELGYVIDTHFFAMVLACPLEFKSALHNAPDEWFMSNPRYHFAKALVSSMGNSITQDGYAQVALEQEYSATATPASRDLLGIMYGRLTHLLATGKFDSAGHLAREIYDAIEEADDTRGFEDLVPMLLFRVGTTRLLQGDLNAAIATLWDARRWARFNGTHPADTYLGDTLALCYALQGDIVRARECLSEDAGNRQVPAGTLSSRLEFIGILSIAVMAMAALDGNTAMTALNKMGADLNDAEYWWVGAHIQARYALYWGDSVAAIDSLENKLSQQRVLAPASSLAGTILRSDLSDLYQSIGALSNAERPLKEVGLISSNTQVIASNFRLEILRGNSKQALSSIDDFLTEIPSPLGMTPTMSALRAVAFYNLHDHSSALAELSRCRYIGNLRGSTEAMMEITPELLALSNTSGGPIHGVERYSFQYKNSEPQVKLSNRELEVLVILVLHASSRSIAKVLFISVNTVKFHLRNIYSKLEVNSREQALQRATELGFISEDQFNDSAQVIT